MHENIVSEAITGYSPSIEGIDLFPLDSVCLLLAMVALKHILLYTDTLCMYRWLPTL